MLPSTPATLQRAFRLRDQQMQLVQPVPALQQAVEPVDLAETGRA